MPLRKFAKHNNLRRGVEILGKIYRVAMLYNLRVRRPGAEDPQTPSPSHPPPAPGAISHDNHGLQQPRTNKHAQS